MRRTLVWSLTVAGVVLLLPILLMEPGRTALSAGAWLTFSDPDLTNYHYESAPPLVIHLELIRACPPEEAVDVTMDDDKPLRPRPAYDALRWLDARQPPATSATLPDHIRYKLDPDIDFSNRQMRLNGLMLRVKIDF